MNILPMFSVSPLAEQNRAAKDYAVLINQFEQIIHPGHFEMERNGLISGRSARGSGSYLHITVESLLGDAVQHQRV